jgi:hypothetical protein
MPRQRNGATVIPESGLGVLLRRDYKCISHVGSNFATVVEDHDAGANSR